MTSLGTSPYVDSNRSRTPQSSTSFGCTCGVAEKGEEVLDNNGLAASYSPDKKGRIVNGYEPKRRPWMVLIELHRKIPKAGVRPRKSPQCGGALINQKWIITAAHCFCMKPLKCEQANGRTVPAFDMRQVTVYLGQHDISRRRVNKDNIFGIKQIQVYPTYVRNKRDQNDLALAQVDRIVTFSSLRQPLCLPKKSTIKDVDSTAYVAGWGTLSDKKCTTKAQGPSKHHRCSFPFVWMNQTHKACTYSSTPSFYDKLCKKLESVAKIGKSGDNNEAKKEDEDIEILDSEGKLATKCYSKEPGMEGWCATCVLSAKFGEAGYCGKKKVKGRKRKDKRHYGRPSTSENWGFCAKQCLPGGQDMANRRTTILQEAKLSTLSNQECAIYGQAMKVVPKIELCAGLKVPNKPNLQYQVTSEGTLVPVKQQEYENGNQTGFHLGGKDSCKGDSGGPLYKWVGNQAVLIGVVSRGKGCATYNQAGIYTKISKKLRWINRHANSGACKS